MRRIPAALCALAWGAALLAALSLYPQASAPPDGMNRSELEAISRKYGLEPSRSDPFQELLAALQKGDWGWSWKEG